MNYENKDNIVVTQFTNYNVIDIVKFICSFLVIFIHIPFFTPLDGEEISAVGKYLNFGLQQYICRLAVPFFFVSSGFFLFKKMPEDSLDVERVKNYCFKVLQLLGAWSVLLFIGEDFHLWYLGANAVAIIFISLCLHFRIKYKHLFIIVCLLYVLGLIGDSYYGFIEPLLESSTIINNLYKAWVLLICKSRNGLFMGSIFIFIGMLYARNKIQIKLWASVTGFIISMICMFCEIFLLKSYDIPADYNMYVFMVPSVFFLFGIACSIKLKDSPIYARLRMIGVLVYFLHMFVYAFVKYVIKGFDKFLCLDIMPYQCIITLLMTLIISICIEWLSHKEKFKWIKWLV